MSPTLLVSAALAHPVNGVFPSHQLELTVRPEQTELLLSVRFPTHEVVELLKALEADKGEPLTREETEAFSASMLDDLRDNLRVELDGERQSWTRRASSAEGTTKFLTYDQTLVLSHDAGPHELHLSNGNLPDQTAYFMAAIHLDEPLVVESSSLLFFDEGVLKRNKHERWRMDEDQREVSVRWRPASVIEGLSREPGLLAIGDALPPEVSPTRWLGLGLLGLFGVLGATYWRRQMRRSPSS